MSGPRTYRSERDQLELFSALPGDLAPGDAQDLMAYPFFSLSKSHRVTPIDFRMGEVARERLVRESKIPIIDLCFRSGSNKYFCNSDFTEDALQHRCMHACGGAS